MGFGARLISALEALQARRRRAALGSYGDFQRRGGNIRLVENLPLSSEDLVIDGGGFKGEWTDEILCRYGCRAMVFEPVPEFAARLQRRYRHNPRVEVVEAALAGRDGRMELVVSGDGSSLLRASTGGQRIDVRLQDVAALLHGRAINELGCLKLNIEGAEYEVLERLGSVGLFAASKILLIQFHRVTDDSEQRREKICAALRRTHDCMFDFPFVWEGWVRKDVPMDNLASTGDSGR